MHLINCPRCNNNGETPEPCRCDEALKEELAIWKNAVGNHFRINHTADLSAQLHEFLRKPLRATDKICVYKRSEVRRMLLHLQQLAQEYGATIEPETTEDEK